MSDAEDRIQRQQAFERRQRMYVQQAEQVVREQQASGQICNGCGGRSKPGRLIKNLWYCDECKSEKEHLADLDRNTRPIFGGRP